MENSSVIDMPSYNEEDFCLNTFGHSITSPGHTYGPAVRPYYLIHYILDGVGEFSVNNTTYHLHKNQGFLIEPDYQTVYSSDIDNPWTYIWVGFSGKQAASIINSLGLSQDNPIYGCENSAALKNCILEMLEHNSFAMPDIYHCWSLFYRFTALIADSQKENLPQADINAYIANAASFIRNHINEQIRIQDIAAYLNLNRSYLSTLFKKNLHMSPQQYIQNCRLTRAKHLLESTSLSISNIAFSCGYEKVESLNKLFRQTYGISPKAYRQQKSQPL